MWYTTFVVLHILSAGIVIGLITLSVIGASMRKKVRGTMGELAAIRSGAMISPIMANIGSIGLLVSGVVLTLLQYSFFPFGTMPWLALMQTDYVVIMAISGAFLAPNGKKILAAANAEIASPGAGSGASESLRSMVDRQYAVVMLVGFLVLLAVILGESKAMMWAAGIQ